MPVSPALAPTPVATSTTSTSSSTSTASLSNNVNSADFLKLLVAQLQNQDPLNPVSDTEFLSQLAQFSQLQGITQLNTQFTNLLHVQQLTQGANLVGHDVVYQDPSSGNVTHGTVQAISLQSGGLQFLINGSTVSFDQIRGITQTSGS